MKSDYEMGEELKGEVSKRKSILLGSGVSVLVSSGVAVAFGSETRCCDGPRG